MKTRHGRPETKLCVVSNWEEKGGTSSGAHRQTSFQKAKEKCQHWMRFEIKTRHVQGMNECMQNRDAIKELQPALAL
jgi:hypothetical protein